MKKLEIIIRPEKLDVLKKILTAPIFRLYRHLRQELFILSFSR